MYLNSMVKRASLIVGSSLAMALVFNSAAHAQWSARIGTGLTWSNVDGRQGFNSAIAGPIKFDINLDPKDFDELTKSAFGFEGYAANGPWLIQYSWQNIELEDKGTINLGPATAKFKVNYKMSGGEVTAGYLVYQSPAVVTYLDAGLRYTKHQFDNKLTLSGAINAGGSNTFSSDWTDAVLGVTVNVRLARQWMLNNRLNVGFGGSDGTYVAQSELIWQFHKHWSTALRARYAAVKYENGSKGNSSWYYYNADESFLGLFVFFNW